jgi:hypothetical protein
MGMESPETALRADDSYRARVRGGRLFSEATADGGFFVV